MKICFELFLSTCVKTRRLKHFERLIKIFDDNYEKINSFSHSLRSDDVLKIISGDLVKLGFRVETSKKNNDKISIIFNDSKGDMLKAFELDGISDDSKIIIEIEAGRAISNYQFLKDVFEALAIKHVKYLVVAVRQETRTKKKNAVTCTSNDYERIKAFLSVLNCRANRLRLPLKGILLTGY